MIGKTYLARNWNRQGPWFPVVVLARWNGKGKGKRNVLVQKEDGTKYVRPFWGLRKPK